MIGPKVRSSSPNAKNEGPTPTKMKNAAIILVPKKAKLHKIPPISGTA